MDRYNTIKAKYFISRSVTYWILLFLFMFTFSSCEINDPVSEISDPGYIAASIYWDVPVTNVTAGNEVEFYAEYWTTEGGIEYIGVWYDVQKTLNFNLTYPGNGYSLTLDSAELAREFIEIKTFEHSEGNFDPAKNAYVLNDKFPVSYTLAALEYNNPTTYNAEQFNQLIPVYVRELFIENLFPQLQYQDIRNMLVTDRQLVEPEVFEGYFDTDTIGETVTYTMKAEAEEVLRSHVNELPFGDLIYNRDRQYYAVEFSQGFQLNARLRIVNGNQIENFSETRIITVL